MRLSLRKPYLDCYEKHVPLIRLKQTILYSGGHPLTDDDKDEEVAESQKLSPRDKKEIQEGLCVNCALVSILFTVLMMATMVLL
jgi:hypothetical protein